MTHSVNVSLAIHDSASQGLAPRSGPTSARGSSTEEPTRLPVSAHWASAGFQPLVSAPMPITMLPPSTGVPSPEDPLVSDEALLLDELPHAEASSTRHTAMLTSVVAVHRDLSVSGRPALVGRRIVMLSAPRGRPVRALRTSDGVSGFMIGRRGRRIE